MNSMNLQDKLDKGIQLKENGNLEFKSGNYTSALKSYYESLLYLKGLDSSPMDTFRPMNMNTDSYERVSSRQKDVIQETMRSVHNNMAACYLKLEKWEKVIASCEKALALNGKDAKTYYRKGQARVGLQDYEKALQDLVKAAKLSPQDSGIRKELEKIKEKQSELIAKSKNEIKMNLERGFPTY